MAMIVPRDVSRNLTIAVSGPRDYNDPVRVSDILGDLHAQRVIKLLIEGACPTKNPDGIDGGLDEIARLWAKDHEVNSLSIPPKSKKIPWPGCGPARSREMARWKPDVWVLFPGGGPGTQAARDIAIEFHIRRLEVSEDSYSWIAQRTR